MKKVIEYDYYEFKNGDIKKFLKSDNVKFNPFEYAKVNNTKIKMMGTIAEKPNKNNDK